MIALNRVRKWQVLEKGNRRKMERNIMKMFQVEKNKKLLRMILQQRLSDFQSSSLVERDPPRETSKEKRTRTRRRRNTKQEERCNQVHNQAASQRMEMMMMSTMLKGYQRGHSSPTPRDHIRLYPLIMIP